MRRAEGNPWASVDPEAQWWKGDTAAHPVITPKSGPQATGPGKAQPAAAGDPVPATVDAGLSAGPGAPARPEAVETAAAEPKPEPERAAVQVPVAPRTARRTRKAKPPKSGEPSAEAAAEAQRPAPVAATGPTTDPVPADPVTADPATADPATAEDRTSQDAARTRDRKDRDTGKDRDGEDRYDEPTDDVMAGSSTVTSPGETTGDPITAAAGPGGDQGADGDPATQEPAAKEPAAKESAASDPAAQGPAAQDAAASGTPDRQGDGYDGEAAPVVPDVMVLPEPGRDRPTVVLARGPVPGQQRPDQPAPERHPADRAVPGRAAQTQSAMATKLETSPFWMDPGVGERNPADTTPQALPAAPSRLGVPPRRLPPAPRKPAAGLLTLLAFALVAAFFAWVSAEPLWLAVGHGDRGTATVTRCTGDGVTQRCTGVFTADGGAFTVPGVALLGVDGAERAQGAVVPARMTSRESRQAFVGGSDLTVHLRWAIGVLLVLLCGLGIAATTGAGRLETAPARRRAVLISLAGPLALLVGFLAVSY